MDLALAFAIFRRLTGYPLDAQGRPRSTSMGVPENIDGCFGLRIPQRKTSPAGTASKILSTGAPDALRLYARGFEQHGYVQVPVFFQGVDRRKFAGIYPACFFNYSGLDLGEQYVQDQGNEPTDGIESTSGTRTIVSSPTGTEREVPDLILKRKHPNHWNVEMSISLESRDPIELMMLDAALLRIFPRFGGIKVERADGTSAHIDFWWSRYAVMDQGEAFNPAVGEGAEVDAALRRTHTYVFETWLDNSVNGFGSYDIVEAETVLQRILELQLAVEDRLVETVDVENLL